MDVNVKSALVTIAKKKMEITKMSFKQWMNTQTAR